MLAFLPSLSLPIRPAVSLLASARRLVTCARMRQAPPPVPLSSSIDVHIIPVLADNYAYIIHDKAEHVAALVDPVEPPKLLRAAEELQARVTVALVTHHHWDHAGGNVELAKLLPAVEIVGSAYETADAVTVRMESGTTRQISGSSVNVTALRTPCHTQGHLCFTLDTEKSAVFSGDTLFVGGCGKFFEGDAAQMETSLNTTLASLQDDTMVFCGHEYTLTNLLFASSVEPDNAALQEKLQWVRQRVEQGLPTVPSTIGSEKACNPFMRTAVASVASGVGLQDPTAVEVMHALRERKNNFRP